MTRPVGSSHELETLELLHDEGDLSIGGMVDDDPFYAYAFIYPAAEFTWDEVLFIVIARANIAAGAHRKLCDRMLDVVVGQAYYRTKGSELCFSRRKSSEARRLKSGSR